MMQKSIKNNINHELIIKKSSFICYLFIVNNEQEIDNYLHELKNSHPKAAHLPYAYILDDKKKYSDDGEPSKTAGSPIFDVLEKNDVTQILAVVVRYFGGIKLGSGGLTRAYSNACSETLNKATLVNLVRAYEIKLVITYKQSDKVNHILQKYDIINYKKTFDNNVVSTFIISEENSIILEKELHNFDYTLDYQITNRNKIIKE